MSLKDIGKLSKEWEKLFIKIYEIGYKNGRKDLMREASKMVNPRLKRKLKALLKEEELKAKR